MSRIALIGLIAAVLNFSHAAFAAQAPKPGEYQESSKLLQQKKYGEALVHIDRFLAKNPKDARGRFLKGVILTEDNQRAEAIRVFTDLTHDYPDLPEPYNNLAVIYAAQGDYGKAQQLPEMAIRNNPGYATALENLGDVYARMAGDAYSKALKIDSNSSSTRAKLALIRELFSSGGGEPKAAAQVGKPAVKAPAATTPSDSGG